MKVVSPGFEILPERENILKQIEERGRLCYKSEDRIEENSHIKFFDKIKSNNHGSVMEMAVIHTKIWGETDCLHKLFDKLSRNKYIKSSLIGEYLLVSGSVRALTEFFVQRLVELAKLDYAIYNESETLNEFINKVINDSSTYNQVTGYHTYLANLDYSCIRLLSLDEFEFDKDIVNKHKYVAVKFTVNRAVSHELVRHRLCAVLQESQRYCRYSDDKFGNEVTFIEPMFFNEGFGEYTIWENSMIAAEKAYLELLESSSPQAARTVLPNSCKTEIILYTNLDHWKFIFGLRTSQAAEPSMREVMIPLQEEFKRLGYV